MRLGVSPAAPSTPTGVFTQRFEALFPLCWSPGLCGLFHSPAVPPGLSMCECGATGPDSPPCGVCQLQPGLPRSTVRYLTGSASHCLAVSPLLPGCPCLPLLQVWMNVSCLSPWLSDFHTVPFSVSPGCFLFLNCSPSFGCRRRHSVSTYASILAGSQGLCYKFFVPFQFLNVIVVKYT